LKAVITCAVLICSQQIYSGERLQHESELLSVQQREVVAREQIAREQNQIESLKVELHAVSKELSAVLNELYTITGYTEEMLNNSKSQLTVVEQKLALLSKSSSDDLLSQAVTIDSLTAIVSAYKGQKVSRIVSIKTLLDSCDLKLGKITTIVTSAQQKVSNDTKSAQSMASADTHNVDVSKSSSSPDKVDAWIVREVAGNGCESLYRIAGYPQVYGDSEKWLVLYKANKELIDKNYQIFIKNRQNGTDANPQDIIFPGQILKIPR
jgi:hypothetical protein